MTPFFRIHCRLAGSSTKTPMLVIDLLAANPYLTVKKVAKELGIAFTTAQRSVEKLEKMSIVKEVTRAKRDRTYCAKVILDILDEPAKI